MEWRREKYIDNIKRPVTRNTLLEYPYFNKWFEIDTDDSNYQVGAVIIQ